MVLFFRFFDFILELLHSPFHRVVFLLQSQLTGTIVSYLVGARQYFLAVTEKLAVEPIESFLAGAETTLMIAIYGVFCEASAVLGAKFAEGVLWTAVQTVFAFKRENCLSFRFNSY